MATSYEQAITELFQAPHERFVAERKRLSLELKAGGDKAGAKRLLGLVRPPVSAWAVNQLWWHARAEVEQLFRAAARQRAGERSAAGAHRQKLAELRARAGELLQSAGHAATEATLRRVTMTLAALAAAGNFDPDASGALTADRDPPGFEAAFGGAFEPTSVGDEDEAGDEDEHKKRAHESKREQTVREEAAREQARRAREAEQQERRRLEAERAQRRAAEHERLRAAFRSARAELDATEQAAALRRKELSAAEKAVEQAQAALDRASAHVQAFEKEQSD